MKDYLIKAYAFGGTVRIYSARTTTLVGDAQKIHDLWPTSAAALGRLLTASIIMGAMYKDDQELTIRIESDGPIEGMLATANTKGQVRGYVGNPHVFLQYPSGKLNVGEAVGNGFVHVTKDLKVRDVFTSTSPIQTGEIAEDFAYYFTSSEQIPSAVALGVKVNDDNSILASGGYILQIMPGCPEETIALIEQQVRQMRTISDLYEEGATPESVLERITQGDHRLLEHLELTYACDCTRERFERGLISLGRSELTSLLETDGQIETVCHFCLKTYHFNQEDLESLIEESKH